jgi:hypothetical protein
MKDKNLNQNIFVFIFIGILVLLLIIAFILRYTIFKTGKYLVTAPQSELDAKGYGTYSTVFDTGCLTASGKCDTAGVKYVTQYCVPHPETGYGCLNENGEMTFESQTLTQNCLPNCRKYTLNNISGATGYGPSTVCQYSSTYASSDIVCVPVNAKTFNYSIYSCGVNDAVGENACNYTCGSGGVTDAGIPGDSDPTLPSYIPNCVNRKGTIISLNSFPWELRGNLPDKGVKISKGYTIFNYVTNGGTGPNSQNLFNIVPDYIPPPTADNPTPSGTGTITTEMLTDLDNKLVVYENCQIANPKPYCGKRVLYKPTQIQSNITNYNKYFPTTTPPNIQQTAACYVSPYWNSSPPYGNSNAINPYIGSTGSQEFNYSMFAGIGQYGYTYEYQSCVDNNTTPTFIGSTGTIDFYNIPPPYQPSILCNSLLSVTGATGTADNCLLDRNFIPNELPYNKNLNICYATFPDGTNPPGVIIGTTGTNTPIQFPGTVVNCQYMPNRSQINTHVNPTTILDPALQDLLGNYIQIYITNPSDSKKYALSLVTSPCGTGTNPLDQVPLANCSLIAPITSAGYADGQPCAFVYNGGLETSLDAGAYWGKNNCDGEMIQLTNALNIIVSPLDNLLNTSTSIYCDLYAYFGKVYGQLYPVSVGPYAVLMFRPLLPSQYKDKTKYIVDPFIMNYDGSKVTFKTAIGNLDIFTYDYNGNVLNPVFPAVPTFNISGYNSFINEFRNLPFNGPVIKNGGIYSGDNITTTLNLQRGNPCYYNKCDPSAPDENNNPCFPYTCNLYYEYNAEIC